MKKSSKKSLLRPTSSVVKQAIFNMLGDIEGLRFLDLFAGTGQIGLMAMERGAEVVFVEKNPNIARKLAEKYKLNVVIFDSLKFLDNSKDCYNIIFADPPYDFDNYEKLIESALKNLCKGGIFILEHRKNRVFPAHKRKEYGDTALSIWEKNDD